MRSTSPPARHPPEPRSVLEELLCIDGVTDLAVYRLLTGRGFDEEVPPGRLGKLIPLPSGGDE